MVETHTDHCTEQRKIYKHTHKHSEKEEHRDRVIDTDTKATKSDTSS